MNQIRLDLFSIYLVKEKDSTCFEIHHNMTKELSDFVNEKPFYVNIAGPKPIDLGWFIFQLKALIGVLEDIRDGKGKRDK